MSTYMAMHHDNCRALPLSPVIAKVNAEIARSRNSNAGATAAAASFWPMQRPVFLRHAGASRLRVLAPARLMASARRAHDSESGGLEADSCAAAGNFPAPGPSTFRTGGAAPVPGRHPAECPHGAALIAAVGLSRRLVHWSRHCRKYTTPRIGTDCSGIWLSDSYFAAITLVNFTNAM